MIFSVYTIETCSDDHLTSETEYNFIGDVDGHAITLTYIDYGNQTSSQPNFFADPTVINHENYQSDLYDALEQWAEDNEDDLMSIKVGDKFDIDMPLMIARRNEKDEKLQAFLKNKETIYNHVKAPALKRRPVPQTKNHLKL